MDRSRDIRRKIGLVFTLLVVMASGCQTVKTPEEEIAKRNIPREMQKVTMPEYVVEPPDIIQVEVLEALPGRPIQGEHLVRPDGKISLNFYGDVYVTGLTPTEIKEKIILHLRDYLTDEVLGLIKTDMNTGKAEYVEPVNSTRVWVDVISYNSKTYYVQGDVGSPGKLPITGNENVLDAIQYAGGLIPTASTVNIRLVRPAPAGACCATILPVNLAAIINGGDPTTNYQLMPGDRIVVYRDPIVRTQVFIDRLAGPFNSVLQSTFQSSLTFRAIQTLRTPINTTGSTATTGGGAANGVLTPATRNNISGAR